MKQWYWERANKIGFAEQFFLRFHMALILVATVAIGVLTNYYLLRYGLNQMLYRYPLTVIATYAAFFIFVRLWLLYVHYSIGSDPSRWSFSPDPMSKPRSSSSSGSELGPADLLNLPGDACGWVFFAVLGGLARCCSWELEALLSKLLSF